MRKRIERLTYIGANDQPYWLEYDGEVCTASTGINKPRTREQWDCMLLLWTDFDAEYFIDGWKVYKSMPEGWSEFTCNYSGPDGFVTIHNNKPLFGGEYEKGLLKLND